MSIRSDVVSGMKRIEGSFFSLGRLPQEAQDTLREFKTPINESPHTWTLASRVLKNGATRTPTQAETTTGVALRLGIKHLKVARRPVQGDVRIGQALGKLKNLSETSLSHRLTALTRTHDLYAVEHHLGALLAMLSGNGNSPQFSQVDFGGLAYDLFEWQDPNLRTRVTTRWVKDAYTTLTKEPISE